MLRNIETERVRKGLTVEELSKALGCSVKTYYNWTHEITDIPGSVLKRMKTILGAESIDYLLEK